MKKFTFLLFALIITTYGFSQIIFEDDFENTTLYPTIGMDIEGIDPIGGSAAWAVTGTTDVDLALLQVGTGTNTSRVVEITFPAEPNVFRVTLNNGLWNSNTQYTVTYDAYMSGPATSYEVAFEGRGGSKVWHYGGSKTNTSWETNSFKFDLGDDLFGRLQFKTDADGGVLYIDNISIVEGDPSSIQNLEKFGFSYYPNPVKDVVQLSSNQLVESVQFFNLLGQQLANYRLIGKKQDLDISELPSGMYIMNVSIDGSQGAYTLLKD